MYSRSRSWNLKLMLRNVLLVQQIWSMFLEVLQQKRRAVFQLSSMSMVMGTHLLNTAIQYTMTDILNHSAQCFKRVKWFYSPKRHTIFEISLTLKSQSVTWWSDRYEPINVTVEELSYIIKALLDLTNDQDPKTCTDSIVLMNLKCYFDFLMGCANKYYQNQTALTKYLHEKTRQFNSSKNGVRTHRNSNLVIAEMKNIFEKCVERLDETIRESIQDTRFLFTEARVPQSLAGPD